MPYVFGYGSLLNSKQRMIYDNLYYVRLISNQSFSVRRSFNAKCIWFRSKDETIKYSALGLEYVDYSKSTTINGLIFEVSNEKLDEFIKREKGYKIVELPMSFFQFLEKNNNLSINENIILFMPEVSNYPTNEYDVNKDYIDICIEGFSEYNKLFALEFISSTYGWSNNLLKYALSYI